MAKKQILRINASCPQHSPEGNVVMVAYDVIRDTLGHENYTGCPASGFMNNLYVWGTEDELRAVLDLIDEYFMGIINEQQIATPDQFEWFVPWARNILNGLKAFRKKCEDQIPREIEFNIGYINDPDIRKILQFLRFTYKNKTISTNRSPLLLKRYIKQVAQPALINEVTWANSDTYSEEVNCLLENILKQTRAL
ncbi:hypothetical protein ACFL08_01850 [Patescibacteria group bacterium]